jgi:hypothetical protein
MSVGKPIADLNLILEYSKSEAPSALGDDR